MLLVGGATLLVSCQNIHSGLLSFKADGDDPDETVGTHKRSPESLKCADVTRPIARLLVSCQKIK